MHAPVIGSNSATAASFGRRWQAARRATCSASVSTRMGQRTGRNHSRISRAHRRGSGHVSGWIGTGPSGLIETASRSMERVLSLTLWNLIGAGSLISSRTVRRRAQCSGRALTQRTDSRRRSTEITCCGRIRFLNSARSPQTRGRSTHGLLFFQHERGRTASMCRGESHTFWGTPASKFLNAAPSWQGLPERRGCAQRRSISRVRVRDA